MTLQTKNDLRQRKENFKKKSESIKAGFQKVKDGWNETKQEYKQKKEAMTPQEKADLEKAKGILWDAGVKLLLVLLFPIILIVSLFFGFIDLGNGKDFSKYVHGSSRRRRH